MGKKAFFMVCMVASLLCGQFLDARTVRVRSTLELLRAIGSNTTIVVEKGAYNLTKAPRDANPHITWNPVFDGEEAVISTVSNLTLRGEAGATIVVTPRYAWVFHFRKCAGIKIENLVLGHIKGGYCTGGVLAFSACKDIGIKDCDLFGCGTYGLNLKQVRNCTVNKTTIRDCTYGIMQLSGVENVRFTECAFRNNKEFNLISITNCDKLLFLKCRITNNKSGDYLSYLFTLYGKNGDIRIQDCTISNNLNRHFINHRKRKELDLKGNTFSGNTFQDPVSNGDGKIESKQ